MKILYWLLGIGLALNAALAGAEDLGPQPGRAYIMKAAMCETQQGATEIIRIFVTSGPETLVSLQKLGCAIRQETVLIDDLVYTGEGKFGTGWVYRGHVGPETVYLAAAEFRRLALPSCEEGEGSLCS